MLGPRLFERTSRRRHDAAASAVYADHVRESRPSRYGGLGMPALHVFLSVFGVVFVAELPDKTALAALVLATRRRALPVFAGAALALAVQSLVAVLAGSLLSLLPVRVVHLAAGVVFLVSAVALWRRKDEDDEASADGAAGAPSFWGTTWSAFVVIFIAEWGDITQIATAALAARYRAPAAVFFGATLALWCVAALAVFVGHRAAKYLNPRVTQRVAALLFAAVGVALILGLL
jgi:Ca2+/H+ antiporter, TMEM165/GDT1 family